MIIALTGTPGTGKTSVAEKMGYPAVGITEFAEENSIGEMVDGEREIDIEELVEALKEEISDYEDVVVEGHLAHHLPADYCVVLRCRPDILRERLSTRDYSDEKVDENVEAEAMDLILSEAVSNQENVIEVDTSEKDADFVAGEIEKNIEEENNESYGNIDWTGYL